VIETLAIAGYRSLRELVIPLARLNVVTGANGSGKSSLYRAVRLLAEIAQGGAIGSLAREGGLQSVLWAGPETISRAVRRGEHPVQGTVRSRTVRLLLGFAGPELGYAIDIGLPMPSRSAFSQDPQIKLECVWGGASVLRPGAVLVERRGALVQARGEDGERAVVTQSLAPFDSMMTHCAEPRATPELVRLREAMRSWRFYDHFRTDMQAPARQAQLGTYTPVLGHDGADLAAALQTIREIGDGEALDAALADAFPGSSVSIEVRDGRFELAMRQPGLLRALDAAELSDGTLRYLLWIAALLTPRPPELMVLNEPETSLHPDLLPALGRLMTAAARNVQILTVSHSSRLIASLEEDRACNAIALVKAIGETNIAGQAALDRPAWRWPTR
jgi:predicted ATPase